MPDLEVLARQDAVLGPDAARETLVVTGRERKIWLEGLVTCEVGRLESEQGTWGLVLDRLGKIQSVVWVLSAPEALWLGFSPGTLDSVEAELGKRLIMEDAELTRPSILHTWFSLHGPNALSTARQLARTSSLGGAAAEDGAPSGPLHFQTPPYGSIDWTGLGGAALVVPSARAGAVIEACHERQLSLEDWTRLRLEQGLGEFGVDFGVQDRPHEAALERRAVNWSKGCYLGQEVVCMQDMRGKVKRRLTVFDVQAPEGAAFEPELALVDAEMRPIARLTSHAPLGGGRGWIAMGRVELERLNESLYVKRGEASWPAKPRAV